MIISHLQKILQWFYSETLIVISSLSVIKWFQCSYLIRWLIGLYLSFQNSQKTHQLILDTWVTDRCSLTRNMAARIEKGGFFYLNFIIFKL